MLNLLIKLVDHLRYPSTWQGIIGLVAAVGLTVAPELQEAIITAGVALAGVVALLFSDSDVKR